MKTKFTFVFGFLLLLSVTPIFYSLLNYWKCPGTTEKYTNDKNSEKQTVEIRYVRVESNQTLPECTDSAATTANVNKNTSNQPKVPNEKATTSIDFNKRYPNLLQCKNTYNKWDKSVVVQPPDEQFNFSAPADKIHHETRFIRAYLVYFPIKSIEYYKNELRWLYRSWTYMMQFEPTKWRTDLIVFIQNVTDMYNSSLPEYVFNDLDCKFENMRKSPEDAPMCTLINHVALKNRDFNVPDKKMMTLDEKYAYLLKELDIFNVKPEDQIDLLYKLMKIALEKYEYADSILMAFEG